MFIIDAGANQVQVGTATAGAIATFNNTDVVFNEDSQDRDFRVESNDNANMLFVDGGLNMVGIGRTAPEAALDISIDGANHSLYLRNDTVLEGLRMLNSVAMGATSGGHVSLETTSTPSAIDQRIGNIFFKGITTGTTLAPAARITVFSAEAWDATHAGSNIGFYVTPLASVVTTEALRIQSDGTLKLANANSWTANGTGAVTITALAPAGVGTATISKWLTITDNAGVVMYIPVFT